MNQDYSSYIRACAEMHTLLDDGWRMIGQYEVGTKDLFVLRHTNGSRLSITVEPFCYAIKVDGILKKKVYG